MPGSDAQANYVIKADVKPPRNVHLALGMKVDSHVVTGRKKVKDIILDKMFSGSAE